MPNYKFNDPAEQEKMLKNNIWKPSKWYLPTNHERINNRYIEGWIAGKNNTLKGFIQYLKDNNIPKAQFEGLFKFLNNNFEEDFTETKHSDKQ